MNKDKYLLRGYLGRYLDYTEDIETVDTYEKAVFQAKYHIKFYEKIVIFKQPFMRKVAEVTDKEVKEVKDGKSKES